jgi:hypothetical protein
MNNEKIYIGEAAEELNRVPHSLRIWMYRGIVPKNLLPSRDERNWRYWTREQIEGLKIWMVESDLRGGKGLTTTGKYKE